MDIMTKENQCKCKNTSKDSPLPQRIIERKIGRSVFIVSSSFNNEKEKDLVTTIARLVNSGKDRHAKKQNE